MVLIFGAPSLTRGRVCLFICCWHSPAQSFSDRSPLGLSTIFYCLSFETSLFVASYDTQGHGGGIRPRLHTGQETPSKTVLLFIPVITVCLERRYHGYVSKGSFKTHSNGVFCVTMRTCLAKLRPTDTQVPAFKPRVTILWHERRFQETNGQIRSHGETNSWKQTDYGTRFPWIRKLKVVNTYKRDRCCGINTRFPRQRSHEEQQWNPWMRWFLFGSLSGIKGFHLRIQNIPVWRRGRIPPP
jgi:hypothetical protein